MRVAMIEDEWWPENGGGAIHVKELSRALASHQNCEVDIFTRALKMDGECYDTSYQIVSDKVTVHRIGPCTEYWNPAGRVLSTVSPLPRIIDQRYDIIHGHTNLPAIPTWLSGAITNTPTVLTVHGTSLTTGEGRDQSSLGLMKRYMEKLLTLKINFDSVISLNKSNTDLLRDYHSNVRCIPNGINIDEFRGDGPSNKEIIFVGRLVPVKRVEDLITGFNLIHDEHPDWKLRIIGDGPNMDSLKTQVDKLGLEDIVKFDGAIPRDEIPEKISSARIFVLPSLREGHPLTLLEAWATELPVITTSVEGIEEFVEHKETGYIIPPKSPAELANALHFSIANYEIAKDWGRAGRKLVESQYTWERIANQTFDLYTDIL